MDAPPKVEIDTPVTFDASSSDPGSDEEIVEYVWSVNGTNYSTTTSEPTFEHTFTERGVETVVLEIVTSGDQRAKTGRNFFVVYPKPTVEGRVVHSDGTAGSGSVQLRSGDQTVAATETNADGSFSFSLRRGGIHNLVYVDENIASSEGMAEPDGRIDIYAIDTVTSSDNTSVDVGTVALPEPHEVDVTVLERVSQARLSDAPVTVTHSNDGTTGRLQLSTGEDGRIPPGEDRPLELAGDIELAIEPPTDRVANETHVESLTVRDDVQRTVEIGEAINVSLEARPNPLEVGENVTLTVDSSSHEIETVAWDTDGRASNTSDDRSHRFNVTEPGEFWANATVTTTTGGTATVEKRITVQRPEFDLGLTVPDRTAAHLLFTLTATHGLEDQNHSIETYEWTLRDEDGTAVDSATTNSSSANFEVEDTGRYTVDLEVTDEFGVTAATNSTIVIDPAPSWVDSGWSTIEIDGVERTDAVEPNGTVQLTVTASNTGTVSDIVDVVLEDDGSVLARDEVTFRAGETKSIALSHTAPERTGDHTFAVTTDHDRTEVSYTVTEELDAEPASSQDTENGSDAAESGDDDPRELDLLPTPSVGTDIAMGSPPRDQLRTVFFGVVVTTILSGLSLVGYAIAVGPNREGLEPASVAAESNER